MFHRRQHTLEDLVGILDSASGNLVSTFNSSGGRRVVDNLISTNLVGSAGRESRERFILLNDYIVRDVNSRDSGNPRRGSRARHSGKTSINMLIERGVPNRDRNDPAAGRGIIRPETRSAIDSC
jgi:hypothetical protein